MTTNPTETWMTQIACNALGDTTEALGQCRYVLHDRDAKFCSAFDDVLASEGIQSLRLPPRSPNLNAFAERWVRSVKYECLTKLILFGERSLQRALAEFIAHYHCERNHQGKDNVLLFPAPAPPTRRRTVQCRDRLGGLLRYYCRAA
jgi:Integrase core domain